MNKQGGGNSKVPKGSNREWGSKKLAKYGQNFFFLL